MPVSHRYTDALLRYTDVFKCVLDLSHSALTTYTSRNIISLIQRDRLLRVNCDSIKYYKFVSNLKINSITFRRFAFALELCGQKHIGDELLNMCNELDFMGDYKFIFIDYPNKFKDFWNFNKTNNELIGWQINDNDLISMRTNETPIITAPDYDLLLPINIPGRIYVLFERFFIHPNSTYRPFLNYLYKKYPKIYNSILLT